MAQNWLKEYGFNAVKLPRRDLYPGDLLFGDKGAFDEKVGDLSMLLQSEAALPPTTTEPVAHIGRTVTRDVDASLGVRILGALFGPGTAGKLGGSVSFRDARSLSVTYADVEQQTLAVLALQTWIEGAKVNTNRWAQDNLNREQYAAVTTVLRTAKLSIVALGDRGGELSLDAPEIQGIVGGGASVNHSSQDASRVTFTGAEPIAFGFQAFILRFRGNVSFGLERAKGLGDDDDHRADAWAADEELDAVRDEEPGSPQG